jgi:hypothetical protein
MRTSRNWLAKEKQDGAPVTALLVTELMSQVSDTLSRLGTHYKELCFKSDSEELRPLLTDNLNYKSLRGDLSLPSLFLIADSRYIF